MSPFEHAEKVANEIQQFSRRAVLFCLHQLYCATRDHSLLLPNCIRICLSSQHQTFSQRRSVECAVFGWLRGRQTQVDSSAQVHSTVSEDDLPFPTAILDNTHLRGDYLRLANDGAEGLPGYAQMPQTTFRAVASLGNNLTLPTQC